MGFSLLLSVANTVVHLLQPWPLAIMIDSVASHHPLPPIASQLLPDGRYKQLAILVFAGFALTVLGNGLTVWQTAIDAKIEQRMILDFRSDLFQHAQRLSLAFHDARRTGELMSRINYAAASVGNVVMAFPPMLQAGLSLIGMLIISLLIQWQLALMALVVVPFLYYSAGVYGRRVTPRLERVQGLEWQSLSIVHESMAMLRVIVSFGREQYEFDRFRKQGEEAVEERVKLTVRQTLFTLLVNTITAAGTAIVFGYGFYLVLEGRLEIGKLIVLMSYVAAVYQPLEQISGSVGLLHTELVQLRGSFQLLDTAPEVLEDPKAEKIGRAVGLLEYKDVSFSYRGRKDTLHEISFRAEPGQRIAIVGPTGAGQDDADEPARPLLRPAGRPDPARRDRREKAEAALATRPDQRGPAGAAALLGHGRREHPLRPARRDDGRHDRGGASGGRPRLHRAAAPGVRDGARRARRTALRRRASAHLRRPRVHQGRADPRSSTSRRPRSTRRPRRSSSTRSSG